MNHIVVYEDTLGATHTETHTSPLAAAIREDELARQGYKVIT